MMASPGLPDSVWVRDLVTSNAIRTTGSNVTTHHNVRQGNIHPKDH